MTDGKTPPANDNSRAAAGRACPICAKPALERFKPFCSRRCADIDLNRWLTGAYAIPAEDQSPDDGGGEGGPGHPAR